MTTLSSARTRAYMNTHLNGLPILTSTTIWAGAAVGINPTTRAVRALVGGDLFAGFAVSSVNQVPGQQRDTTVTLEEGGQKTLAVSGAVQADVGKDVYATDDDTFTLTSTGGSFVGVAKQLVSTGKLLVEISPISNLNAVRLSSDRTALVSGDGNFAVNQSPSGVVYGTNADQSQNLQAFFDSVQALTLTGLPINVMFPANQTLKINAPLVLYTGVGVDFNGLVIDASGIQSGSGSALSIYGKQQSPFSVRTNVARVERFVLQGAASEANDTDGVFLGRNGSDGEVSGLKLCDYEIRGFRDGLYIDNQVFICSFVDGDINACWRRGVNYQGAINAGENLSWRGGRISDCTNAAGTAVATYMENTDNGNNELMMYGVSLSYNDKLFDVRCGALGLTDCHLENDHLTNTMGDLITDAADLSASVRINGGTINPTEAKASSRPLLFSVSGNKSIFTCSATVAMFDRATSFVNNPSGTPHIDLRGMGIDIGGSPRFPRVGSPVNRAYNPGFELGTLAGWASTGTLYVFTADSAVKKSGTYSAKMVSTGTNNGSISQKARCEPGQLTTFCGWMNVTAITAGSVIFQVIYLAEDGSVIATNNTSTWSATTSGFVEFGNNRNAPVGAAFVQFTIFGSGFTGTAYLDDVELCVM